MSIRPFRHGDLDGCIVETNQESDQKSDRKPNQASNRRPALLVVLCHGYGAPGGDLVPIGEELHRALPEIGAVRFLFPIAPEILGGHGEWASRAWWPIDIEALEVAMATGSPIDRRNEQPPELPSVRIRLHQFVDAARIEAGLPWSRVILGGFSQGAMLALDLCLRLPESPGGLVVFSGTLLNEIEWREAAPARRGLRVLQSHGSEDALLSFAAARRLADLLLDAGLEVDFMPFRGPHTIPHEVMARFAVFLRDRLLDV